MLSSGLAGFSKNLLWRRFGLRGRCVRLRGSLVLVIDIVIDTNIFMHSVNAQFPGQAETAEFLGKVLDGTVFLCIDEGFDLDEAKNRSKIGSEYFDKVRFVDFAWHVIATMGKQGRIVKVTSKVAAACAKTIRRNVYDKTDRVFVQVSCNSRSKSLVSHDFTHFPDHVRAELCRAIGVDFSTAAAARELV